MKALLLSLLFSLTFYNNEPLDKCNGIDHFVFGSAKEQFKNLSLELEHGNAQLYTTDSKTLNIAGVQINELRLSFIKNKLSAVSLTTKNGSGVIILNYLKGRYGIPLKNKNQLEWSGKHVLITCELYKNHKEATVDFYSK
ncbi:MAG: hypothetical protein V4565_06070 [Bacteroidota bacterium]